MPVLPIMMPQLGDAGEAVGEWDHEHRFWGSSESREVQGETRCCSKGWLGQPDWLSESGPGGQRVPFTCRCSWKTCWEDLCCSLMGIAWCWSTGEKSIRKTGVRSWIGMAASELPCTRMLVLWTFGQILSLAGATPLASHRKCPQ